MWACTGDGLTVVAVMTNDGEPIVTNIKMTLLCVLLLDAPLPPDVSVCITTPEVISAFKHHKLELVVSIRYSDAVSMWQPTASQ